MTIDIDKDIISAVSASKEPAVLHFCQVSEFLSFELITMIDERLEVLPCIT